MQGPSQTGRQFQPRRHWAGCRRPAQDRAALVELNLDFGTEVKGEADIVATALDLVGDVDAARCPVQQHRPAMQGGRVKRGVAVVLSRPRGDVAVIDYFHFPGMCMAGPHKRAAFARLAPATELGGVVRDRRAEV